MSRQLILHIESRLPTSWTIILFSGINLRQDNYENIQITVIYFDLFEGLNTHVSATGYSQFGIHAATNKWHMIDGY